ncbi:multicopper oxidase family protein [Streptomyces sp. B-S-A8]|uniref:Multicopper oxidase CueO n=1 Tax=Streptomyces solicavernae TaxID=3043614 RepID=A0ABT6RZN3_9ACTN|nr:multicopper oxidase family protein [Streptomyces sp. B-S-A8]MDI3389872.1 multicopper oxidase family protein [Streptomyces sp. B-S-A8]
MATRRRVLGAGLSVAGVGLTGVSLLPALNARGASAAPAPGGAADAAVPLFAVEMPLVPVLAPVSTADGVDTYEMTMRTQAKEILPGVRTELRTFNGQFPGPTIKARRNRPVVIRQRNELDVDVSVHLHGASVPPADDGGPMDVIAPGAERQYTYPNKQPHAPLWYHDHAHHLEAENVYRGLHGSYLLTDDEEEALPLPTDEYDVLIAIRDAHFDTATGALQYQMGDRARTTLLVNGAPYPYFKVAARSYRLRLANHSNQRFLELRLEDDSDMTQIASDGGLLPRPHTTKAVYLTSGERADVVVDFSRYPVGTRLVLKNTGFGAVEDVSQVMRFDVARTAQDNSSVPDVLRKLPPLPQPTAERTVVLSMDEDGRPDPKAYIDGKLYDHARVDAHIRSGASEIWTVTNANTKVPHNFHMHLVQFRVLERQGAAPRPEEEGLKDTVRLMPGETVKLQATFDAYRGEYVYHCHMLDHSAMGMMATMKIG